MYLDSLIAERSAKETSVSYSEMMSVLISSVEEISQSELAIVKAEFMLKQVATEGADEWWAKIKAFFRKIWENVKRVIVKFVAWCRTIPDKIIVLWRKILTWWSTYGLEGKIKSLKDNIAKGKVWISKSGLRDYVETDWGICDADIAMQQYTVAIEDLTKKDNPSSELGKNLKESLEKITYHYKTILKVIVNGDEEAMNELAEAMVNEDDFEPSNFSSVAAEFISYVSSSIEEIEEKESKGNRKDILNVNNIFSWFNTIKNGDINKKVEVLNKKSSRIIDSLEKKHKRVSESFERLYKEDDKDGVQTLVAKLKLINYAISGTMILNSKVARIYAKCAQNLAKKVLFVLKVFTSDPKNQEEKIKANGVASNGDIRTASITPVASNGDIRTASITPVRTDIHKRSQESLAGQDGLIEELFGTHYLEHLERGDGISMDTVHEFAVFMKL